MERKIAPVVHFRKLKDRESDFAYWQKQSYEARIAALEEIRSEYYTWLASQSKEKFDVQSGFKEFIASLNDNKVRYLVVGGYAVAFHGHPRFTKDLDIWVDITGENPARIVAALAQFGMGSPGLKEKIFSDADQAIQLGYPPNRIDLVLSISGVEFNEAYEHRAKTRINDLEVNFINISDQKINKKASGRMQDLADLENLQ